MPVEYDFTEIPIPFYYEHMVKNNVTSMHKAHYHICHEIYYLVKGEINYFINDQIYNIHDGDLILIPKGILHKTLTISEKGYERILINVYDEFLKENVKHCFENFCYRIPPKYGRKIIGMLQEIEEQNSIKDEFREEMIQEKIHGLLVTLIRLSRAESKVLSSGSYDDKLEDVMKYVREHFSEPLTLQNIADHFFVSREYFSSMFKQKTGLGFNEYLNQIRVSNAMKLLENPNETITGAAYKSGYNDSSYFASVFKKVCGISPKKYQIANRISEDSLK